MWETGGTLAVYTAQKWADSRPLAAFDFDSTLRRYRGRGPPEELGVALVVALSGAGNRPVVIFTNRSQKTARGLQPLKGFVAKVERAGGACDVYAASGRDRNRKPQTGGWKVFLKNRTPSTAMVAGGFYCGDAAGRDGDFAASDRFFAENVGLRFYVPEQFFGAHNVAKGIPAGGLASPAPPQGSDPCGHELTKAMTPARRARAAEIFEAAKEFDVVVMVGSPASGKSTFARRLVAEGDFARASRDAHGNKFLHRLSVYQALPGQKVVVDNTNPAQATRQAVYDRVCAGARLAVVWVKTPQSVCRHFDGLRCERGEAPALLPRPVIPTYWKRLEAPTVREFEGLSAVFELELALADGGDKKRYA